MKTNKILLSYILISILIININECLSNYLKSGIKQLNNFIYKERMKTYSIQNLYKQCRISLGPNCYFTENKKIKYEYRNIESNSENEISDHILDFKKEWIELFSKSKDTNFYQAYNDLNLLTSDYKKKFSSKNDSQQIPPAINLYLSLTFESYDDITIKGDFYAYPSKPVRFNTENIFIEILGKLRLTYGEDSKLKNSMKYPSKTYGIIESTTLGIRLGGKQFICDYFFLRIRNEKILQITIEGHLGNTKIFSVKKVVSSLKQKVWNRIFLPEQKIDRLSLPGGIDVDNFHFIMETMKQYYITAQFHNSHKERIKDLIQDSDIY